MALAKNYIDRGKIVLAGVFSDSVDSAVLIFKVDDRSSIEEFSSKDPYAASGQVTRWWIQPWSVGMTEEDFAGGLPCKINIFLNWFEELKERAPVK